MMWNLSKLLKMFEEILNIRVSGKVGGPKTDRKSSVLKVGNPKTDRFRELMLKGGLESERL